MPSCDSHAHTHAHTITRLTDTPPPPHPQLKVVRECGTREDRVDFTGPWKYGVAETCAQKLEHSLWYMYAEREPVSVGVGSGVAPLPATDPVPFADTVQSVLQELGQWTSATPDA